MKKVFIKIVSVIAAVTAIGVAPVNAKAEVENYKLSDIVASAKKVDAEGTKCMRALNVGTDTYRIFLWKENDMLKTDVWYVSRQEDPWNQLIEAMNYIMAKGDPE